MLIKEIRIWRFRGRSIRRRSGHGEDSEVQGLEPERDSYDPPYTLVRL